ncbi:MAG TPA: ATP-binding protein [Gemmatimonadaceae bacterium]|nr:ATP-binding protein [Gemmatimonadaceae bacterium]
MTTMALSNLPAQVLRVPLLFKLLGANALLVAGAVIAHYLFPGTSTALEISGFLVASFALTGWLVWVALRPIASLEETASRVSRGDYSARVPPSRIADRDIVRLTGTVNKLLDRVEADRARIHYLAGRGARAREIERESVARELRESFAQTLSGITMQLAAAQHEAVRPSVAENIQQSRTMLQELTDEMRSVAETLYPGTLSEFGLLNAIEALARRVSRRSRIEVDVDADARLAPMSARAASALYRVAEEALRNIEQHALARNAQIRLMSNGLVTLTIEDDGRGIDMKENDPLQAGLGLFSARAVLALSGGELQISSGPGLGTQVIARVPSGLTQTEENHGK